MHMIRFFLLFLLLLDFAAPGCHAPTACSGQDTTLVEGASLRPGAPEGHTVFTELMEQENLIRNLWVTLVIIGILLVIFGILLYFELRSRTRINTMLRAANEQLSRQKRDMSKAFDYLVESEAKYRNLVENSPTGILLLDAAGTILEVNGKMLEILGSPGHEETRKINCLTFPPLKKIGLSADLEECLASGRTINRRVEYKTKWGRMVHLNYTITPILSQKKTISRLILNVEDITEAILAEKARKDSEKKYLTRLEDSEKALKELNAMKDKFFSIIAHDLKNPFNSILGLSNLLNEAYDNFPEKQRKAFIKNICEASENTFKLLQNLLEWSRTQTGQIEYMPQLLDVETLVNDNIAILNSGFVRKNIEIAANIPTGVMIFADENMVRLVLRNLMANALKFTHPGGRVEVLASGNEVETVITVQDNGVGLSRENLDKVFRIDYSLKTKGTAKESGSGLGLILCQEFIQKNQGRIWATSTPGKGSAFSFSLPSKKPDLQQEAIS